MGNDKWIRLYGYEKVYEIKRTKIIMKMIKETAIRKGVEHGQE